MTSLEQIKANLEANRSKVHKKDYTFYNVDSIATLAKVCEAEKAGCDRCRANYELLDMLSQTYPELIASGEPGKRKLEDSMDGVFSHLCKVHGYSRRGWFQSLYSLYGLASGLVLGTAAAFIVPDGYGKIGFLVPLLLCVVVAYLYGGHVDFRQEKNKKVL